MHGLVGRWPHTLFFLFPSKASVAKPESSRKFLGSIGTHESVLLPVPLGFQCLLLAIHLGQTLAHELGGGGGCWTLHGFPLLQRKYLGEERCWEVGP